MKIAETLMTPADASKLLEANTSNRLLNPRRVNVLSACIARGEWIVDGNPIKLAEDGTLLDGQHRLAAIVQAKQAVTVALAADLPRESQVVMDSGRSRSFGDYLRIRGVGNISHVAAAIRLLWVYESGAFAMSTWRSLYPTNQQLWELYEHCGSEVQAAISVTRTVRRYVPVPASVLGVCWMIFNRIDADDCDDFFAQLGMQKTVESSPVLALSRLLSNRERTDTGSLNQQILMAFVIKAWNAYRAGDDVQLIKWRRGGSAPEKFPEPR